MKHKILPATLVVVLFATLVIVLFGTFSVGRVPTVQARDDNTCSNANEASPQTDKMYFGGGYS